MEVRGRNRKWLRAVGKVGVIVLFKFCARVGECGREGDTLVVVSVVELVAYHKRLRCQYGGRSRRRSVDGKKGADSGELAADFFFLDVEKTSDVLNHLFVGVSHLGVGGTVRRRGGDNVGSVASTVDGRGQVRRNENRGG